MTVSCRSSTFRSGLLAAAVIGVASIGSAPAAWAQACCASAGLVAPTRLRSYEDFAAGLQARARSVFGAFNADGAYVGSGAGESEWNLEQDLFAVARVFERGQVSLLVPFVETRRTVPGIGTSGGGVGDVVINARYDFLMAGERRIVPGLGFLLGLLLPTGTPPEGDAGEPLATDATGIGSYEASAGVAIEQAYEPYFVTLHGLVGWRSSREVTDVRQSFALRWTGMLAIGRVLPGTATLGGFMTVMRQADNRDQGGTIAGSGSTLLTPGLAGTVSAGDEWRVQGTVSTNVPVAGAGRNQTAGLGVSLSLVRLWL